MKHMQRYPLWTILTLEGELVTKINVTKGKLSEAAHASNCGTSLSIKSGVTGSNKK